MNPRVTTLGYDAVAISDYQGGLSVPTSSTNFGSGSSTTELVVSVPPGEGAYIVIAGFAVEEWEA